MLKKSIQIKNAAAMQKFAAQMAREIVAQPFDEHAKVIALVGDLGAGKTTFAQGLLRELGVKRRVISPTFLIIRPYSLLVTRTRYSRVFHIDCYRLNNSDELLSLGFKEILKNPQHIVLIEWPELIKKYLPKDTRWVKIEHPEKGMHRLVRLIG